MGTQRRPDRRLIYTLIVVILLLYGLYMHIAANNRKYAIALATAAAGIERTRQAISDQLTTEDTTSQALMTQTRVVITPTV